MQIHSSILVQCNQGNVSQILRSNSRRPHKEVFGKSSRQKQPECVEKADRYLVLPTVQTVSSCSAIRLDELIPGKSIRNAAIVLYLQSTRVCQVFHPCTGSAPHNCSFWPHSCSKRTSFRCVEFFWASSLWPKVSSHCTGFLLFLW